MRTSASTDDAPGVSARLSQFLCRTQWQDIPPQVRHEAKRSLMNFFACSLGGCRDAVIESASAVLGQFGGPASATVIGRNEKFDVLNAVFLNAASANVFDFDDTHARTIIHPTAPVAPPLLAHAEGTRISGEKLLLALVLGVETECRIGNAISPGHYRRGWHITSTCGVFGAAAAAGKALNLSEQHMNWALGNASAQAGGLLETLGTMGKSISVGNAARNGLVAAMFAQQGVFGPEAPLEGTYGFLRVTGDNPDFSCITRALGDSWEIALNTYKPYPCGIVLMPVVEACLTLVRTEAPAAAEVKRIEITAHPLLRERTDRVHPLSGREAQVSAQHAVAVTLTRGRAGLAEFSDACAVHPTLSALRESVVFNDEPSSPVESAAVTVHLRDGRTLTHRIDHAHGSVNRPLSDGDLEQKLKDLIDYGGSKCKAQPLVDAIWALDSVNDAGAIMRLAAGR
ncbi:MAG TPA: MmgE/PrpD family protein [Burkholderiales bacterium]|nr:MmgE/PrpD family protein [Burkholderiales bacterium]